MKELAATIGEPTAAIIKTADTVSVPAATTHETAATINETAATINETAATTNETVATINQTAATTNELAAGVHLFRSWMDPLFNFFPCTLRTEHGTFRSSEHYFQYRLLMHHGKQTEAEQCKRVKYASQAKALALQACPTHNTAWEEVEREEMQNINKLKLAQCSVFRTCLKDTGEARLLHNMERDSRWGIGKNAQGRNWLGIILEQLRDNIDDTAMSSQPTDVPHNHQSQSNENVAPILVLGDSMISQIKEKLEAIQSQPVIVKCVKGANIYQLNDQLPISQSSTQNAHYRYPGSTACSFLKLCILH